MRDKMELLKNRKILILLCVEMALLLLGVFGLFGKSGVILSRQDTGRLVEEGIPLKAGVYTLKLYYEAQGTNLGSFGVTVEDPMYKTLLCNSVSLYSGITERECQFYLLNSVENLKAVLNVSENVEIQGMELIAEKGGSRIWIFWVVVGSLLLDGYLLAAICHRRKAFSSEKQLVLFGIPVIVLISSIPTLVDYNIIGTDLGFHMMRIEALSDSMKWGELGVRIESMWLGGHGYANSIFCGDTWLALPALLRVLGFPMDSAYRIFVVTVNLATALIAYVSFSRCFRSRYVGFFGSLLYTLAPYRLYNLYNQAAVGEYTAMIFLPLLVWGFYRIYTEDPREKGYLWNWVIPVLGFSGMIQSHGQSCGIAGGFVVLLCLILWKKTFRRRTFLVLLCTVGMTVVINAWYLVPFLDLMGADKYYFGNNANMLIQSRGILPAQILYTLQAGGRSSHFVENGMLQTEPIGLGAALLLCLILWLAVRRRQPGSLPEETWKRERWAGDIALGMTVLALFMSTCLFPWDLLSNSSSHLATLIGYLQFPTRFTAIVTVLGVFLACVMGVWALRDGVGCLPGKAVLILVALVSLVFGNYQVNDILLTRDGFVRVYTAQNMESTAVRGAEYLPLGAEIEHMTYHAPATSEGVSIEGYGKDGLKATAYVTAPEGGYVEFPMLYYKGYRARASETGETLRAVKGNNSDVRIQLPEGFQGTIRVWYAGMWYWRLAEAISVFTGIGFLAYYLWIKVKKSR